MDGRARGWWPWWPVPVAVADLGPSHGAVRGPHFRAPRLWKGVSEVPAECPEPPRRRMVSRPVVAVQCRPKHLVGAPHCAYEVRSGARGGGNRYVPLRGARAWMRIQG